MTEGPGQPSEQLAERIMRWVAPLSRFCRAELAHGQRIPPSGPVMFVGNHQLFALDSPLLMYELWRVGHRLVRPMADNFLFRWGPLSRQLERIGLVRASRENARQLFNEDAWILVYPGGAREATKPAGRPYELSWWDRLGFAEVALRCQVPVVPIAARGIDSSFKVLISPEQIHASWLGRGLRRLPIRDDLVLPLVVPRRWPHVRFHVCPPVYTDMLSLLDPQTGARRLRAAVAEAIESALEQMELHAGPQAPQVHGPLGVHLAG